MTTQIDGREHDGREVEDMGRGEKCTLSPEEVLKCLKDSPRFLDKSLKPRTQEIVQPQNSGPYVTERKASRHSPTSYVLGGYKQSQHVMHRAGGILRITY
jgi:hypothetical protein